MAHCHTSSQSLFRCSLPSKPALSWPPFLNSQISFVQHFYSCILPYWASSACHRLFIVHLLQENVNSIGGSLYSVHYLYSQSLNNKDWNGWVPTCVQIVFNKYMGNFFEICDNWEKPPDKPSSLEILRKLRKRRYYCKNTVYGTSSIQDICYSNIVGEASGQCSVMSHIFSESEVTGGFWTEKKNWGA